MKKLLLIICCLFTVSAITTAQELQKNIFGIRAGLNLSSMKSTYGSLSSTSDTRVSFNVGASYQRLLSATVPLYLETGLYLTDKGETDELDVSKMPMPEPSYILSEKETMSAMYIQVPVLLNYHFAAANTITIQPFAGLYAAYGIAGKIKTTTKLSNGNTKTDSQNSFSSNVTKRFDFGAKFGVGATFGKIYTSIGYELGLANISNKLSKIKNINWALTFGYNF
ncbi:MAG: PorT family protein [Prevotellaceae bacterium]|jgi:hypothetical protein|nr:PorT family protein [Prevotellaceae bacterium]